MRKRVFSLLVSGASLLAGTGELSPAWAEGAPSAATGDAAGQTGQTDPAADPESARLNEIDKTYRAKLAQTLGASADPRDWALASLITGAQTELARSLHTRAADAPGDALVQWIVLSQSSARSASAVADADALTRLQAIEAGNASVWMYALMRAAQLHDAGAIDEAMRHMAASTYTDEHWYDAQKALIEVFKRNPPPDEYFALASSAQSTPGTESLTRESWPYFASVAIVAAMPLPAYQSLANACKPRADFQPGAARIGDCAKTGRTMAAKGNTLVANRIGFTLLRVTHAYNDDDVRLARAQDWIWEKSIGLYADTSRLPSAAKLIARVDDQNATGNELEAMRRELVREGLPTEPPADWIDTRSPFSAERLRADETALTPKSNRAPPAP
ncbi:MAG: hypothetical protein JSS59_15585 [Proteobacteria bacterium]|uniref:hypothetical protein n=1 Tax=Rudaea sp. TaxID=2136325 RepID=UPI0037852CB2|nr:hypothetical protein [Pseudomonadota bacterium]